MDNKYNIYPLAWIGKSQVFMDYVSSASPNVEFLVADFASGEHDRTPSFFLDLLPKMSPSVPKQTIVYCIDIHALRLDSLLGTLEESNVLKNARVVQAKLETMDKDARFRPDMIDYLESNVKVMTLLDYHLKTKKFIPSGTFDLGVLNNDMVGYLHEYYKEYSDAAVALQKVHQSLKKSALLVVTMPCSLYVVNNIEILETIGFEFLEGKDIDLENGSISDIDRQTKPQTMSRLGHYSFLIFISK
ncbi:MAG: hypothetical protein ACFFEK_09460 [Candidatus Thorarchaeota archaeon]